MDYDLFSNLIFASLASVSFALMFNVPKKLLKYCAIGGSICFFSRSILMELGLSIILASFFASLIVSILCFYWSRKHKKPRPAYTVASIIPIIPGKFAILSMMSVINMANYGVRQEELYNFLENAINTTSTLGVISFAIALPSLYFIREDKQTSE